MECNDVPPSTWFMQYVAARMEVNDPFLAYWGDYAPYINCGPDGCARGEVIQTQLADLGLSPYVNCDADGVTCNADEQFKTCTSFNWADTFTDPLPEGPEGPVDGPNAPDCTDASNPCIEPGG
jgi:hypothetical protein